MRLSLENVAGSGGITSVEMRKSPLEVGTSTAAAPAAASLPA